MGVTSSTQAVESCILPQFKKGPDAVVSFFETLAFAIDDVMDSSQYEGLIARFMAKDRLQEGKVPTLGKKLGEGTFGVIYAGSSNTVIKVPKHSPSTRSLTSAARKINPVVSPPPSGINTR